MNRKKTLTLVFITLLISLAAAGCDQGCQVTANYQFDLYRVPDANTDVWGIELPGNPHEVQARTADGWVGFDPGVMQAPNIGLARLRYFQLNAVITPSCLGSVPVVTIADVEADIAASGGP